MKKRFLRITMFFLFILVYHVCDASMKQVPVNVEFEVSPYNPVYFPGEVVNVDVRIYFDRDLVDNEIGREYLVKGNFTTGCEIKGLKKKRTNEAPWAALLISESSFNDNYFFLRNQSDEVNGNFKIKITEEITRIELYAISYTLGEEYFQDKPKSLQITVKGETISYIRSRRCDYLGFQAKDLQQYNKNSRGNRDVHIAEPHDY